jgi:hypothetical protein
MDGAEGEIGPTDKFKLSGKLAPFSRDCGECEPCVDHVVVAIRTFEWKFGRSLQIASEVVHLRSFVSGAELGPCAFSRDRYSFFVGQMKGLLVHPSIKVSKNVLVNFTRTCHLNSWD